MNRLRQFIISLICSIFCFGSLVSPVFAARVKTSTVTTSLRNVKTANTMEQNLSAQPSTMRRILPIQGIQGEILPSASDKKNLSLQYNFLSLLSRRVHSSSLRLSAFSSADTSKSFHHIELFSNATTEQATLRLTLGEGQPVEISAFNILGKRVMDISSGQRQAGLNVINFDISQLSQGMYICVVRGQRFKTAEKFLVSR